MVGEGQEQLRRFLEERERSRAAREEQEAKTEEVRQDFSTKVVEIFLRDVQPSLDDARDLIRGYGQSADTGYEDHEDGKRLVLVASVEGKEGRLIFAGNAATSKVTVSCRFANMVGEQLGEYTLDELTSDVVQKHLDYFSQGLIPR